MSLIELSDIRKYYQLGDTTVRALDGVSLQMERGELVSLIGPSGSGKSTMMNTLGCLDRPTSGIYRLDGLDVVPMSRDQRARIRNRQIGFVFQSFNLLARTSAIENVELPLLYGDPVSPRERRLRAMELLDLVGLGDRFHHHPGQLSGGQQQRVAIARALATAPSILMGDEPTGNLDRRTSREVIELFGRLNAERKITVVLVTHDLSVAKSTRRSIVMRDGKVIGDTLDPGEAEAMILQAQSLNEV